MTRKTSDSKKVELESELLDKLLEIKNQRIAEEYDEGYVSRLQALAGHFCDAGNRFKRGDLVVWKEGLKNKNFPEYGQPAVVIEQLERPIINLSDDSGSSYYREPLDLILAILSGEGQFVTFYYDSRRFQIWTSQTENR